MFWILFSGCLSSPVGLVVPLLFPLSFIDGFSLLKCLLILYYILFLLYVNVLLIMICVDLQRVDIDLINFTKIKVSINR